MNSGKEEMILGLKVSQGLKRKWQEYTLNKPYQNYIKYMNAPAKEPSYWVVFLFRGYMIR